MFCTSILLILPEKWVFSRKKFSLKKKTYWKKKPISIGFFFHQILYTNNLREQAVSMNNRFFEEVQSKIDQKSIFQAKFRKKIKFFENLEGAQGVEISRFQIFRGPQNRFSIGEGVIFDRKFGILAKFWPRIDIQLFFLALLKRKLETIQFLGVKSGIRSDPQKADSP